MILILTGIIQPILLVAMGRALNRESRCGRTPLEVCIRKGNVFSYGLVPLRLLPAEYRRWFTTQSKWKTYEKRNYYQFDGKRKSYSHS